MKFYNFLLSVNNKTNVESLEVLRLLTLFESNENLPNCCRLRERDKRETFESLIEKMRDGL